MCWLCICKCTHGWLWVWCRSILQDSPFLFPGHLITQLLQLRLVCKIFLNLEGERKGGRGRGGRGGEGGRNREIKNHHRACVCFIHHSLTLHLPHSLSYCHIFKWLLCFQSNQLQSNNWNMYHYTSSAWNTTQICIIILHNTSLPQPPIPSLSPLTWQEFPEQQFPIYLYIR